MKQRTRFLLSVAAFATAALPCAAAPENELGTSLARLRPDPRFARDGRLRAIDAKRIGEGGFSFVRLDSAGRIVVAGATSAFASTVPSSEEVTPYVARFLPSGRLDRTFGQHGVAALAFLGAPGGLVVDADDRITVVGRFVDAQGAVGAARFLADGSIDPGFGMSGFVELDTHDLARWEHPAVSGGKLTVVSASDFLSELVRVDDLGHADAAYGTGGRVDLGEYTATDIAVDAAGRAVVARRKETLSAPPVRAVVATDVVRFGADGTRDLTFANDGVLKGPGGGAMSSKGLEIDAQGRVVMIGAEPGTDQDGVFRFEPEGALDVTFSGDGRARFQRAFSAAGDPSSFRLSVAPGGIFRYSMVAGLTFSDGTLVHPVATGYAIQTMDPSFAGAVGAFVYRDRRPVRRVQMQLGDSAIAPDGSSVVAVGSTEHVSARRTYSTPMLVRVNLTRPTPVPLPDLYVQWVDLPAADLTNGFSVHGTLRVANIGAGASENAEIQIFLSTDAVLSPDDWQLGSMPSGRVGAGKTTDLQVTTPRTSSQPGFTGSGRFVIALINGGIGGMETDLTNNTGVSGSLQ